MGGGPVSEVLLCAVPFAEPVEQIKTLRQKFPHIEVIFVQIPYNKHIGKTSDVAIPPHVWKDVTILVTLFTFPKPSEAPNLKLIHLISAGSNQLQGTPIYNDTDITITTSTGIHGPQIAEWVIMTGLVITHHYNMLHELQKQHEWGVPSQGSNDHGQVRDWVGRRVGILGYGSIGRQVGRVVTAMGAEVIAYTATSKDTPEQKKDHGFIVPGTGDSNGEIPKEWYSGLEKDQLHRFLQQDLDWLIVAVPLTDKTRHFLSTDEFRILSGNGKRPVFVTNIARGPIIDQPALIEALKADTIAGAALDVTDPEPLPKDNELWDMKNVIITPHVSGNGVAYTERVFQVLTINLERQINGEKLINVVRRSRGY